MPAPPILIVFGGLPGTGKTTLSRMIAQDRRAAYLRIDAIEQALRGSGVLASGVGPAGYEIAYALAASNLSLGRDVVSDSVNPIAVTREAWRAVAAAAASRLVEIELVCSDHALHRRRVETRSADIVGLSLPSWDDVVGREYDGWERPSIVLDTAHRTIADSLGELRSRIAEVVERPC